MFFGGSLKARNLLGKSCLKNGLWPEINHRNLDGFYTDVLGVASQEIFGGNLVKKMAYGKK